MTLIDLNDLTVKRLRNIAFSADIDLDGASKKQEIIEILQEEEVELTQDGWMHGDEQFELKERTSSPSDTNVLYGFRRSGATDDIMEEIQGLFQETQYEMRLMDETDTGKKPFKIVIPAEADESE